MKKLFIFTLLLLALILPAQAEEARIVEVSDLHYLSRALVEEPDTLMRILASSDGKVTHYTPEICRAFVDRMLEERPDAVLISGDLTLNGGRESHAELIDLLRPLREAGIPVLTVPGNHDETGVAYRFTTQGAEAVEGMEPEEFMERYADFGYADARSRDEASFSYLYEVTPTLWVLALDVNSNIPSGSVQADTLEWAAEQLAQAREAGARVIAMTHQNLMVHFPLFTFGYQLNNAKQLQTLLDEYGVTLVLSGHTHLQHIAVKNGVTEITTSALAVWPHHMGELTVTENGVHYEAQPLDVAAWARKTGSDDPNLLDFDRYSSQFFDDTTCGKLSDSVAASGAGAEEQSRMLEHVRVYNRSLFSGSAIARLPEDGYDLWQQYLPDAFFTNYMKYCPLDTEADMRRADIP